MSPEISIVVCTHNRAAALRGALSSLFVLRTDGCFTYEVVIVDNASADDTQQAIAAAEELAKLPVRNVFEAEKGIVPARNRGIREARGRWIAFFDDDQLADPRWLAELYRGARDRACRVVGGSVQLSFPEGCPRRLDPTVRMLLGEAVHSDAPVPYRGRLTPGCGNLMIKRDVFEQVGVFERTVHGRGEDTDLFNRIERAGIEAWYIPTAIVHHLTPLSRLDDQYLLRLARHVGEGVALRQANNLGRFRFALMWLAKAARLSLIQSPRAAWRWLTGDRDGWLDRRCALAINASLLRAGLHLPLGNH